MGKILAFIIIFPMIIFTIIKSMGVFDLSYKTRYLTLVANSYCYKVKITGVFNDNDMTSFKNDISKVSKFEDTSLKTAIKLEQGIVNNNGDINITGPYTVNSKLTYGLIFKMTVVSSEVSFLSRLQNLGVSSNDAYNMYYGTSTLVRIEADN